MEGTKTCTYCQTTFIPKRKDAQYCSNSCRYKSAHQRRLAEEFNQKKEIKKRELLAEIAHLKNTYEEQKQAREKEEEKKKKRQAFFRTYEKIMAMPYEKLYPLFRENELKKYPYESTEWFELRDYLTYSEEEIKRGYLQAYRESLRKIKARLETEEKLITSLFSHPEKLYEKKINKLIQQLEELDRQQYEPPTPFVPSETSDISQKKKKIKRIHPKEMGAEDVLNMNFNTFILPGELGRFLGELDRNMVAIALTGDSGAGKTYLSFALAKLFLTAKMKVKYFSLEEGIGKLTQEKIAFYDLGNELKITAEGTLLEIKQDADYFDVIIIDSYSKLTSKPEEFEALRQEYPQTIFVIIFQKTTSGTIRGGSSIKYNSSATIDVVHKEGRPTSIMQKSRYGTQNWEYDNKSGRIIKEL